MTAKDHSITADHDDKVLVDQGYTPKFLRSLGLFSSFAVSFSAISITLGIFANYGLMLTKAGPFGVWSWVLVGIGQTLVALVFAEMAGRMPMAGGAYNWNTRLAGKMVGWVTGWVLFINYSIATAAVTITALPLLGTILGVTIDHAMTTIIGIFMLVVQAVINFSGVRITSKINTFAVCAEIVSTIGLAILVALVAMSHGNFHLSPMVEIPATPRPYINGFLGAILLGAWGLIGFEASVDVGEETVKAKKISPRGVISSVVMAAILGFLFICILTGSIKNLGAVTAADNPLVAIVTSQLGETVTKAFLVFVVIAIFSCSLIIMALGARVVYAISRDGRFPASSLFQKISSHYSPTSAICLVTCISIIAVTMSDRLETLYAALAIIMNAIYLITVICFAYGCRKLPDTSAFSLGRWHWPVVTAAIVWLIFEIGVLTIPEEFHAAAYATGIIFASGVLVYFVLGRRTRA